MNVLKIFYENIVPEAQNGKINCWFTYNMPFSTFIMENNKLYECKIMSDDLYIPTLMINDKEVFDMLLCEYVDLAINFYDDSNFNDEILNCELDYGKGISKEKVIMTLLFANATADDYNNPINFLSKRINFLKNYFSSNINLGFSEILGANLSIAIEPDIINNKTPSSFVVKAYYESENFLFPGVKFGISDDTVYVYAIQNKKMDVNNFTKKINRKLYKVDENFNNDSDNVENLGDISASFLFALNIFIAYFKKIGYTKFQIPSILISRWNAKKMASMAICKRKNLGNDYLVNKDFEQIRIQNNITNKLIRTFLRLKYHYNNIFVSSFPGDVDNDLHIFLDSNVNSICNNKLLDETSKLVLNNNRVKNGR